MVPDGLPFTAAEAARQQAILAAEFAAGWFEPPPEQWQLADAQASPGNGSGDEAPGGVWAGEAPWPPGGNPPPAPAGPPGAPGPQDVPSPVAAPGAAQAQPAPGANALGASAGRTPGAGARREAVRRKRAVP